MVWSRHALVLLCGLGLACGPSGEQSPDTDSEGETESEGESGSTGSTNPTTTTTTATTVSTTTSATTTATSGPMTTDTGPDPDTATSEPPPPETTTGDCPYGTEGCLCDVGAACDEGLMCIDGTCVAPPPCEPIDTDPHNDEATATDLGQLNCGEGAGGAAVATIFGPEVDWYMYFGNEAFGCPEQPAASVTAADPLEVCVFLECDNGGDVSPLNCAAGSTDAMSPDGRAGCCGENAAGVEGYDCTGFGGKDVNVWISVGSDQEICADYDMDYQF